MRLEVWVSLVWLALPLACGSQEVARGPEPPLTSLGGLPAMRWDQRPEAAEWTSAALHYLEGPGAQLTTTVPDDIGEWCPAYPGNASAARAAFWVGLLSALAKHESTWNPQAVGGGGRWFGLVQISPATARHYGCSAQSGAALKDGSANLTCALRIMARTVARDGVVAAGGRGVAADWGPFNVAAKRADMSAWTSSQAYCQ